MLSDAKFYLALFLRRLHYFLVIALAIAGFGLTMAYTLPPVYKAQAQLLVESPQIPGELASSTVRTGAPEILQIIRQRLLTRANLLEISREFDVHANRADMSPDDIVNNMRGRIDMRLPRQRDVASFVTISFAAPNGRLSAEVTNELVTRVLEENVAMRKASSGQTLDFFKQEVARLDRELADQGQLILEFKLQNKNALPDSLDFRRAQQASVQERVLQVQRNLVALRDRRTRLQELYEQTGRLGLLNEDSLTPDELRLKHLQDELASALTIFSDQNPRVKTLQSQLKLQEEKVAKQNAAISTNGQSLSPYDLQMADIEGQMEFLSEEKTTLEHQLNLLAASIDATPANAVTLGTLERDYENLRVQYNQATADLAAARTGDQIEAQSRGQRISVLEQATIPGKPTDPNRRAIAMVAIAGGVAAGLGFIFLLELLNGSIRRPADLSNRLGITPLVTIPYIRSRRQIVVRRSIIFGAIAFVAIGIPAGLYLLHLHYLPMDLIVERALNKTGLAELLINLGLGQG